MRLHPREFIVKRIHARLYDALIQARTLVPDLTYDRDFAALGQVLTALVTGDGTTPPEGEPARSIFEAFRAPVEGDVLTLGEQVSFLGEQISSSAKYLIRLERHGTTDKSGGEA